jgi:nucleoside-diphosphate-sugar epimerase
MTTSPHVLVTGATGFLGGRLARNLAAEGCTVRGLGRNPAALEELSRRGIETRQADLRDRDAIAAACAGIDVVVHVGALSAPWGRRSDFFDINVSGTEHVIGGCLRHGVSRLVHVSSPSVIFDGKDVVDGTEDAPFPRRFLSLYSLTKKLAEDAVRGAADLETVIIRPKAIFGPGDTALLPRLLAAGRAGRLPQIGDGTNLVDLTYVDNVVHALRLAVAQPDAANRTFTITNGQPVVLWDVIRRMLAAAGCSIGRRIPYRVAYAAAALMEARARFTGTEPLLTRYSVAILARTQTYSIDAARRWLRYEPVVTMEDALDRTVSALAYP